MYTQARISIAVRAITFVMLVVLAVATGATAADAAHKCPNRFFKKVRVKGIGDSQANATKAYDNDLAAKIAAAQQDCTDCECEDEGETCTFMHTQSKQPRCAQQGPGWKCVGFIRPGCFCLGADEELVTATPPEHHGPAAGH
jgi:hypothetical protein